MQAEDITLKNFSRIAMGALAILLLGAIVFYKERLLFGDPAFILYSIVNFKMLYIQEHRYGSFITQIVPYFGQMAGLPLKVLLFSYAISFNLFYLAAAAILHRMKQYALVILLALYFLLFASESYYWMTNEIHQAVTWMFLLLGVTKYLGERKANIIVTVLFFVILAFLTISTHTVVIIPTVFLLVYFIIRRDNWPFTSKTTIFLCVMFVVVVALKFMIFKPGGYDSLQLRGVTHCSIKDVIKSFFTPVVSAFLRRCVTNYWLAMIVFAISVAYLLRNGRQALAVWTLMSAAGYVAILGLTYGEAGNIFLFHIESEWTSLAIIIAAGFVFEFLPRTPPRYGIALLLVIILVRLCYIGYYSPSFTARVALEERILTQMRSKNIKKLAIIENPELGATARLTWALPYESTMLSGIDGDRPMLTFFFLRKDDTLTREKVLSGKGFYDFYSVLPTTVLNGKYFPIDTIGFYHVMNFDELMK